MDGTSKIDTVAAAVTQLSKEVSPSVDQFGNPTGTLFDGLQTLLAESRGRDMTIHALQASVNTLFAAINERLPSGGTNGTLSKRSTGRSCFWFVDWRLFFFVCSDGGGGEFVRQAASGTGTGLEGCRRW